MKKSGLADSPFFAQVTPHAPSVPQVPDVKLQKPEAFEATERANARTSERVNTRTGERLNARNHKQMNARTPERRIVRASFNIYEDQLIALRRYTAKKSLEGESLNLSDLARTAFDDYLKNNT